MLDSLTVARSAGLEVQRRGSRWFASSPFRNERTPSLCFFPDGRWHDFGGGQSGDAADLYAALHGVTLGEALRVVRGEEWHASTSTASASMLSRSRPHERTGNNEHQGTGGQGQDPQGTATDTVCFPCPAYAIMGGMGHVQSLQPSNAQPCHLSHAQILPFLRLS